jgi:RNA polymerase sigma-70 factor (ECF subfamily)
MTAVPIASEPPAPPAEFEHFHRRFAGDALRYARAIVGPDRAEDACQEAWLRAWRAWGSAEPGKAEVWLRTIIRNCCFDAQRRGRPTEALLDLQPPGGTAPDDAAMASLELETLWAGLERLSPALRETLWLREVLALPYAEIARRQHIPVGTVMSRLHAARVQARRLRSATGG